MQYFSSHLKSYTIARFTCFTLRAGQKMKSRILFEAQLISYWALILQLQFGTSVTVLVDKDLVNRSNNMGELLINEKA